MNDTLLLQIRPEGPAAVVSLQGRLDGNTSEQLAAFLGQHLGPDARVVVLDCAALHYVSSAGLRELLKLAKQVHRHGAKPALVALNPRVAETIEITGLNPLFHRAASVQAGALAAAGEGGSRPGLLGRLFGGSAA